MTDNDQRADMVKELTELRDILQEAREIEAETRARLDKYLADHKDPLLEEITQIHREAKANTDLADHKLREMAKAVFMVTGEPKPIPGVEVKQETIVEYDVNQAFYWAIAHQVCLRLDSKNFDALARAIVENSALGESMGIDFVFQSKQPKVFIASKLIKPGAINAAE